MRSSDENKYSFLHIFLEIIIVSYHFLNTYPQFHRFIVFYPQETILVPFDIEFTSQNISFPPKISLISREIIFPPEIPRNPPAIPRFFSETPSNSLRNLQIFPEIFRNYQIFGDFLKSPIVAAFRRRATPSTPPTSPCCGVPWRKGRPGCPRRRGAGRVEDPWEKLEIFQRTSHDFRIQFGIFMDFPYLCYYKCLVVTGT